MVLKKAQVAERVKPGGKGGELWRRLQRDSEGWASEEEDAALLLMRRISWEPYGVLGLREESVAGAVGATQLRRLAQPPREGCVVVDPAGLTYIQEHGPAAAGAASRAVYDWLQLRSFSPRVQQAVTGEGKACLERYGPGKVVVHAVGPDFRENDEEPVERLAAAYAEVLRLFVQERREVGATELRLLPISWGVFAGKYQGQFGHLTAQAMCSALQTMAPGEKQVLGSPAVKLRMCIFKATEMERFTQQWRRASMGICIDS